MTAQPKFNREAVVKTLAAISKAPAEQLGMSRYCKYQRGIKTSINCKTAYCIGGWMIAVTYPKYQYQSSDIDAYIVTIFGAYEDGGALLTRALFYLDFIGVAGNQLDDLLARLTGGHYTRLDAFDNLPAKIRKGAMCNVLQGLLDTGEVDWISAIDNAVKTARWQEHKAIEPHSPV